MATKGIKLPKVNAQREEAVAFVRGYLAALSAVDSALNSEMGKDPVVIGQAVAFAEELYPPYPPPPAPTKRTEDGRRLDGIVME